ncbi:hypothetical protein EUGRSUZ_C02597 [Eucalyptus grandis]|uniref:Uncharacterized protein n=2 Tax=Eucalyptus grandis TaxID=71139 RepID=A0ACC3LG44_EUCGR|nr:hypothetical protein EUGRSUZ_C02597 [Eucalyptus grandis]
MNKSYTRHFLFNQKRHKCGKIGQILLFSLKLRPCEAYEVASIFPLSSFPRALSPRSCLLSWNFFPHQWLLHQAQ